MKQWNRLFHKEEVRLYPNIWKKLSPENLKKDWIRDVNITCNSDSMYIVWYWSILLYLYAFHDIPLYPSATQKPHQSNVHRCRGGEGLGSTIHIFHDENHLVELHFEGFIFTTDRIAEIKHHIHEFLTPTTMTKTKHLEMSVVFGELTFRSFETWQPKEYMEKSRREASTRWNFSLLIWTLMVI